jgi:N-acetylmuramoyl-L-alanine amidase
VLFLTSGANDGSVASTDASVTAAGVGASRSHSNPSADPAGPVLGAGASIAGSVEHWSTPGYSRITIRLDEQRQPNCARVPDPERLYCDFAGLTFPVDYTGEDFPNDPLVAGLRVGQYRAGTARVVFDLKVPSARHAIAVLSNPPRLMVEIMDLSKMGVQESSSAVAAPTTTSAANPLPEDADSQAPAASRFTIVIDPGHGGRDTGTIGPDGLKEKDLVLDVAQRLGDLLRSRLGARVVLTRNSDRFLSPEARSEIANRARASLFVSIHGNGSDYAPAKGIETYYLGESVSPKDADVARVENETVDKSNSTPHLQLASQAALGSAAGKRIQQSRQLAVDVQESLYQAAAQAGGTRDRGVRTAPFVVLKDAQMPAILAEISFVSSKSEEHKLMQPAHREALAVGLFEGIAAHLARGDKGKAGTVDSAALP